MAPWSKERNSIPRINRAMHKARLRPEKRSTCERDVARIGEAPRDISYIVVETESLVDYYDSG